MTRKKNVSSNELNVRRRDEARAAYMRQGGALFESSWLDGEQTAGERLLSCLIERGKMFRDGICPPDQFDSLDYSLIETALTLGPFVTYEHAEDEHLTVCDDETPEIKLRNRIVDALADYCRNAAALAQKIGSAAREGFVRAFLRIGTECQEFIDGCPEATAKEIARDFDKALTMLWADLAIHDTLEEWEKRPEPKTVVLGAHAKEFVSVCYEDTRAIKFMDGKSYKIPSNADKAWRILKLLLETDDSEGYVKLDEKWHVNFRRTHPGTTVANPKDDLTKLRYHIFPERGRGRKGTGRFRLEARPNKKALDDVSAKYRRAIGKMSQNG